MSQASTSELQGCVERLKAGDESARRELIGHAYERLRKLARVILHESFPRLEKIHETDSIVNEAVVGLLEAIGKAEFQTTKQFFFFSASVIRNTLTDLARRHDCRLDHHAAGQAPGQGSSSRDDRPEPGGTTDDPAKLARWTEFHEKVAELPKQEREVFDLHWYHGLSQAETAEVLGIHPKEVSRRWLSAIRKLRDYMPSA